MTDPYRVLNISPNASEEEITKAYRNLAKKYHPDLNPGNKAAEDKMKEINAAYEQIKNKQTGGATYERADGTYGKQTQNSDGGYGGSQYGGYGGYGGFEDIFGEFFGGRQQQNTGTSRLQMASQYIAMGQYQRALYILAEIRERNAEWYFYSAIANGGIGNNVTALAHIREAVRLDPDNPDYQTLLQQFMRGSFAYQRYGRSRGFSMTSFGAMGLQLFFTWLFCAFCCRPC